MNTSLGAPSPFRFPIIWDSLSLGGGAFTWSGRVDFVGAKRPFSWQHKIGPGVKGTVDTFRGTHTHPFMMRVYVWTDAQWQLLPGLLSFFQYDGTKIGPDGLPLANPVEIYHPALAYLDITQVTCEEILAPEVDKERSGAVWLPFKLHEFLPAIPSVNTTKTPTQTMVGVNGEFTAGSAPASVALVPQKAAIANEANVLGIPHVLP
jgi:hypothetical protein